MKRNAIYTILVLVMSLILFTSCTYLKNYMLKDRGPGTQEDSINGEDVDNEIDITPIEEQRKPNDPIDDEKEKPDEKEEEVDEPEDEEVIISISLAGDCTIGTDETFTYTNSFPDRLKKVNGDWSYFFAGVKDIFENDDLTLVNLESTFTTATKKADKTFRFKGDPSYVNILTEGSVEMVNLSNNHIYDYLQQGFDDTIKTLEDAGILYCGEGYIAHYEAKGMKIASLGYQGWSTNIKDKVKEDIDSIRDESDLVIVSFHWGKERSNNANDVQKELGRFAIDQGADVVAGHHPHVIQGIERYKDRYIIYSLANFCFGGNRNPKDKDTFIFQNEFTFINGALEDSRGIIIPCSVSSSKNVNDYQPTVLEGDEAKRVMDRILEYSKGLEYGIISSDF
ncbi:MAG: CapA family protein [Clostridiales bacterium]|nr:CapA family protein [Clostridiales bacterium]